MYHIKFTQNWNGKLLNEWHTTIRPDKGIIQLGHEYVEELKDTPISTVRVESIAAYTLHALPETLCLLDTGYSKAETIAILSKMHRDWIAEYGQNARYIICLLHVISRERGTFELLLRDAMKRYDKLLAIPA